MSEENKSECNCCFEYSKKYLRCNNYNCKYKMCENCYYRWYVSNNSCPHCTQEQLLIFDNHRIIINFYDGYYLRRIYYNTMGILLTLSLTFPFIFILLLKYNILNYSNYFLAMIILMNPFKLINLFYRLTRILLGAIIKFNNILYIYFEAMLDENVYTF